MTEVPLIAHRAVKSALVRVLTHRPRQWMASDAYAERYAGRWHRAYGPMRVGFELPRAYGDVPVPLDGQLLDAFPAFGVLQTDRALVIGPHGWVIDRDGVYLPEQSLPGIASLSKVRIPRKWPERRRLRGVCLSIATDYGHANYGHFLLDGLSRLHLVERAGISIKDVDYIYCPQFRGLSTSRLMRMLGVPEDKCIPASRDEMIEADVLLSPSCPTISRNYAYWVPGFLRAAITPDVAPAHRRLYVTRRDARRRRLVNEDAILPLLARHGFEIYEKSKHPCPPKDFAQAEIVVGPHGAGLSDIAFCRPGTVVLEIIPSDHARAYFCSLARGAGLKYGYMVGRSLRERRIPSPWPSVFDFAVDERTFAEALERSLARVADGLQTRCIVEPLPAAAAIRTRDTSDDDSTMPTQAADDDGAMGSAPAF